jgi:hypothetical protein
MEPLQFRGCAMRSAVSCVALALLAGCSVVPPDALTFDPSRPPAKTVLPVAELAALTDRIAELQLERNEIRNRIAAQPDILERQRLYAQLHRVGTALSPLERRLGTVGGR